MARPLHRLAVALRIDAVRRIFSLVDVRAREVAGLVALAACVALFEGIGLSLLLPILQFAQEGVTAITQSSGFMWSSIRSLLQVFHLPVSLLTLLVLAFIPIIARNVVFYVNAWYSSVVSSRIALRLRMKATDAIMSADPDFFTDRSSGELVGVIVSQTTLAGQAVLAVINEISVLMLLVLYAVIMFALSVPLTLLMVAAGILISFVVRKNSAAIRAYAIESTKIGQGLMGSIVERLHIMPLVKLRHTEAFERDAVEKSSQGIREIDIRTARLNARTEITSDPLLMLAAFFVLYIGITQLGTTLAQLTLIMFIITRVNAKIKEFNAGRQAISQGVASIMLVTDTISQARAANTICGGELEFSAPSRDIVFKDVSFCYGVRETNRQEADMATGFVPDSVLEGVNVAIPAGSFTALVGRSGAGKSTLVELLPRLHDLCGGDILYDGRSIREFTLSSLRRGIGYLTQDALLIDDTVRANLCYGLNYEPTDEQIDAALASSFSTFVYDLPGGLESRIGEVGARLSGGERQRIALARVLLQNTGILVLDEPTSSLDSESEEYIRRTLQNLRGSKTMVVIAHRLATVKAADQLIVIEDGRVAASGTHDELMGQGGTYRKLFESQLLT